MRRLLLLLGALLVTPLVGHGREATVVVIDFDMLDTSLQGEMEGPNKADLARLEKTEAQIRRELDASKAFRVVNNEKTARIMKGLRENQVHLHDCNLCEIRAGKAVDADYVLVGWVQKVSNLILNLNVALRQVPGGEDIVGSSVDMRGNTDEAWSRAGTYLVQRELLPEFTEVSANSQ
ncbi:MAG: DUF3280 domain-containing protein [Gammaproteobacteria bacterium]